MSKRVVLDGQKNAKQRRRAKMKWQSGSFPKSSFCVDLLSFDPGIVNCGAVHVRVDTKNRRFCVLHAALLNMRDPHRSLRRETPQESAQRHARQRKPTHVEPYAAQWPQLDFTSTSTEQHRRKLSHFDALADVKFEHEMALLPFALCAAPWLDGSDAQLDAVLVEVQDPQNPKMRALGHSVQTFYENVNARVRGANEQIRVQYVSSRLKLSDAVLGVLANELRFSSEQSAAPLSESLAAVVSRRSHAAKKSSAVQVFKAFDAAAPSTHSFFVWARAQRNTKHNIFDALLQALSWMMQEAVGFDAALLNGRRRSLQSKRAKERRREDTERAQREKRNEMNRDNVTPSSGGENAPSSGGENAPETQRAQRPIKRRRICNVLVNLD